MRGQHERKKQGSRAAALWLLLPLLALIVLKVSFLPQVARFSDLITGSPPSAASRDEMISSVNPTKGSNQQNQIILTSGQKDSSLINTDVVAPTSKLACNLTNYHSDTCRMEGDVCIHGKSATVYVVSASAHRPENSTTIKIRPYARKWEEQVMVLVREVTVQSSSPVGTGIVPPQCLVRHDVPAMVFSTGGYNRNFFHVMTDIIIPLYSTIRGHNGHVQLLATDYEPKWIAKYRAIIGALSIYPVIDMDSDAVVRCFPSAHVGLESHKELGIDTALSSNGYTMMSFRDFLRSAYLLQRPWATPISKSCGQKPRLVMVLQRHSRALTNEADAIAALMDLSFEVVAAGPEVVSDMDRFAKMVNSCDVLVGVHGAGLTNMVFLTHNATVVQIIPWGDMKWACRHAFGEPVPDMGLRYVEYEATMEETTLKESYRTTPCLLTQHPYTARGSTKVWATFLNGQNVTLDINWFKGAMQQVYQSIMTE